MREPSHPHRFPPAHMRPASRPAIAFLLSALVGCTTSGRTVGSDPFAGGGGSSGRGARTFDVLLEVACDQCMVSYQVGIRGEQESVSGSWTQRLRLRPLLRTAIRLSATASQGSSGVRGVRIRVDDETVAEAGCAPCDPTALATGSTGRSLTVETVIPR